MTAPPRHDPVPMEVVDKFPRRIRRGVVAWWVRLRCPLCGRRFESGPLARGRVLRCDGGRVTVKEG